MVRGKHHRVSPRSPGLNDVVIGARIRFRRLEREMTQQELGKRLGISFQQVQKYEKGINRMGASRLQQLAEILEVEPSYFLVRAAGGGARTLTAMEVFARDSMSIRVAKSFPLVPTRGKRIIVDLIEYLVERSDRSARQRQEKGRVGQPKRPAGK